MRILWLALGCVVLALGCGKKAGPAAEKKSKVAKPRPGPVVPKTVSFCGKALSIHKTTKAYCRGQGIVQATPLASLRKLRLLDVSTTKRLEGLEHLVQLPALRELVLFKTEVDFQQVAKLTGLRELKVIKCPSAKDLSPVARLGGLTYLRCSHCGLTDIAFVGKLPELQALTLSHTPGIRDFKAISTLKKLRYLNLSGTGVKKLGWISGLGKLERLFVAHTKVTDLRPLAKLTQLRELNLAATGVRNISALTKLINLDRLNLRDNPKLRRLAPLRKMVWLKTLTITAKAISKRQLARLKKALPRTTVRVR